VLGDDSGLQRPRHAAVAVRQDAVAEQPRHRQATPGQELQRGDPACLLGAAVGQVGLEDRLLADGEDLVAILSSSSQARAAPPARCRVVASTSLAVSP
jgi:hypothetical protein